MRFFLGILALCTGLSASVQFEFYGDSVTAGLLASTDLSATNTLPSVSGVLTDFYNFGITRNVSILSRHERKDIAWPNLLSQRLVTPEETATVLNFARSQAKTEDLLRQTRLVNHADRARGFFFMGHNDLAEGLEDPLSNIVGSFVHYYSEALKEWDALHTHSVAYLLAMADISAIFEALNHYVWYQNGLRAFRCSENWERYFVYARRFSRHLMDNSLRKYVDPRRESMNQKLNDLASYWNKTSRRNNRFEVLEPFKDLTVASPYFAIDCYHLSPNGQQFIADQVLAEIH